MAQFKNLWKFDLDHDITYNEIDTRQLRGGPFLRIDANRSTQFVVQTNTSKKLFLGSGIDFTRFKEKISRENEYFFYVMWQISNRFSLTSKTQFNGAIDNNQYVMQPIVNGNKMYVVGKIDRKTIFTTLRAELFVTPELSLQYYGSPYASVGKYLNFRAVEESKSKIPDERFSTLQISNTADRKYLFDRQGNQVYNFASGDPNFNFQEFRSNFVVRWEYKTGSTLYFVWTNNRSRYEQSYTPSVLNSFKGISKVKAQNAFMLKLSYWFSL